MKKKAYMICDWADDKARAINSAPHIGVEYMGNCHGRIVDENNKTLGTHFSSSYGWLRNDLSSKVDSEEYEVVDLIGKEVPEKFRREDYVEELDGEQN